MVDGKKQGLPFANVYLEGTTTGTTSQIDGSYTINVGEGEFTICYSFVGYKVFKKNITVVNGEPAKTIDVVLTMDGEQLEEVQVVAKTNRESEVGLLINQKKAAAIVENIGSMELSRKGASNVAAGVKKVTGVSTMGSLDLFVRGLGDRYNNAVLNGLPIGSPNPDRKVIPLDLFPTSIVKNIGVKKVFTVVNYADFSGGTIDIETKDFLSKPFFKISVSSTHNSITTGEDFSRSKNSDGISNFLGLSAGDRKIPSVAEKSNLTGNGRIYIPGRTAPEISSDPFKTDFGFDKITAAPELSFNISGGKQWDMNEKTKIAGLFSLSYKNEYSNRDGKTKELNNSGTAIYDYDRKTYGFGTNTSALGSISLQSGKQNINFSVLYLNSTEDNLNEYEGFHTDHSQYGDLLQRRITYRKHHLYNIQSGGKHPISNAFEINWKGSYNKAESNEPDRKDMMFVDQNPDEKTTEYHLYTLDASNISRYFQELSEDEYSGYINFNFKFGEDKKNKVSLGFQLRNKERNFDSRTFNHKANALKHKIFDVYNENTVYFTDQDYINKDVKIEEIANAASEYNASLEIYSSYIDFLINLNSLTLNLGVRAEKAVENVKYKLEGDTWSVPFRESELDELDFFPAINIKYAATEKSNFRLSASRTISRPEFKEMSPFPYIEVFGGAETRGNADLENAYNYNADLKYEFFPTTGELLSFTLFGKYLEDPIEKYTKAGSTTVYSFINTKSAIVAGAEFEFKKKFSSFIDEASFLSKFFVGINASYIYSNIDMGDKENAQGITNTEQKRDLQGASPYLGNVDINYEHKFGKNSSIVASLVYNIQGERIYSVGTEGAKDIYEKTLNTMDFLLNGKFGKHIGWKLEAKNILNSKIEREQDTPAGTIITDSFKKGIDISFGLSYSF